MKPLGHDNHNAHIGSPPIWFFPVTTVASMRVRAPTSPFFLRETRRTIQRWRAAGLKSPDLSGTEQISPRQRYIVRRNRGSESRISGEDYYFMFHIDRYIRSLLLAAAIAAPTAIMAEPKPQDAGVQIRVYDRDHRDYHNWNDHEDRAYRGYLTERHRTYREYNRQHAREQRHYWKWRHEHPDHD